MTDVPAILGGQPLFPNLIPLVRPTLPRWTEELATDTRMLLETGMLTKGSHLRDLESSMAEYLGVRHVLGVSSCTLGLLLTYQALGLSGEVIVPSFTFMATVHPLSMLGIEPVFVDIDGHGWNLDLEAVERAITPRTSAIVGVHVFGNPAQVDELEKMAWAHGVRLVFDSAHGFGTKFRGACVGGFGDAEVFSMSPTKLLVAGEGGIVATDDDNIADSVYLGREYGNRGSYDSEFPGLNARLTEFNAILALKGLEMLEENAEARNRLASQFRNTLRCIPGIYFQKIHAEDRSSYKDITVWIDEWEFGLTRDDLSRALRAENIDSRKYYDPPVHRHHAYRHLLDRYKEALPVTDIIARGAISFPVWSHMSTETVSGICDAIARIQGHADKVHSTLVTGTA